MERVVVIGAVGSGKTTLGRRVAAATGAPYTDLDALAVLPGWVFRSDADFRPLVERAVAPDRWVIGGDFPRIAGAVIWPRADTIVWLDLPRPLTLWRVVRRTVRQLRTREEVYPGCVQTLGSVRRTGLLLMAWRHPGKKRMTHPPLLAARRAPGAAVLRLRSRRAVTRWITAVEREAAGRR